MKNFKCFIFVWSQSEISGNEVVVMPFSTLTDDLIISCSTSSADYFLNVVFAIVTISAFRTSISDLTAN